MSTDQPIAPPAFRPIWTPEDALQTARDAQLYRPELGIVDWAPAPTSPPRGRRRAPERTCLRPRRALRIGRLLLAATAIVLVLTVGVVWAGR